MNTARKICRFARPIPFSSASSSRWIKHPKNSEKTLSNFHFLMAKPVNSGSSSARVGAENGELKEDCVLFSFGAIADIQYADDDDAWDFKKTRQRRYRHALDRWKQSGAEEGACMNVTYCVALCGYCVGVAWILLLLLCVCARYLSVQHQCRRCSPSMARGAGEVCVTARRCD